MATGTVQQHTEAGANPYPWYDSHWLWSYTQAKRLITSHHPGRLETFMRAFEPLRTRSQF